MIYVKSLFFCIMHKLGKIKYFGPSKALGLCLLVYQTSQGQCQACQNLSPAHAADQQESVPHRSAACGACRRCLQGDTEEPPPPEQQHRLPRAGLRAAGVGRGERGSVEGVWGGKPQGWQGGISALLALR